MHVSLTRRALFTGRFTTPAPLPIRPPWALDESAFLDACTRCDACLSACDEGIVTRGNGGYPIIDFNNGECTFCRACVDACADGALTMASPQAAPWNLTARIAEGCLSANGVTCRVCGDRCDARAVRFQLAVGGIANPVVDVASCTGCGACVQPCPAGIITIEHHDQHNAEEACV